MNTLTLDDQTFLRNLRRSNLLEYNRQYFRLITKNTNKYKYRNKNENLITCDICKKQISKHFLKSHYKSQFHKSHLPKNENIDLKNIFVLSTDKDLPQINLNSDT